MKSYVQKPSEVTRAWHVLDASEATLGRVASLAAKLLIGKHKATFTAHVDGGDFVVIVNSSKIKVSGQKLEDKKYYRHSGHPGNLKEYSLSEMLEKNSNTVLEEAVKGMLPRNKLAPARLKRLKIYKESTHDHAAQNPIKITLQGA